MPAPVSPPLPSSGASSSWQSLAPPPLSSSGAGSSWQSLAPTQGQAARCATVATTKIATYNVGAKEDRMHLSKKNEFLDKLLKDTHTILDKDCAVDVTMHMATT